MFIYNYIYLSVVDRRVDELLVWDWWASIAFVLKYASIVDAFHSVLYNI